jgi:hypothetical protein
MYYNTRTEYIGLAKLANNTQVHLLIEIWKIGTKFLTTDDRPWPQLYFDSKIITIGWGSQKVCQFWTLAEFSLGSHLIILNISVMSTCCISDVILAGRDSGVKIEILPLVGIQAN